MGVLIKDMGIPKSGTYEVSIDNTNSKDKTIMSMFVRGDGGFICCGVYELVHVPPHGRLIEADALMKILSKVIDINASIEQRNEATDQERRCLWWFEQQIGIAPTIIPADPAEEGE